MSNLQDISSIKPVSESGVEELSGADKEYEKGKRFFEKGSYGEAAVALHNAMLAYEEKNDETGMANTSNQLGHLCLAREEFDRAAEHYGRARELCEKFGDPLSLFSLSKSFVDVYIGLKEYSKAINTCLDLLDVYRGNNDPRGAVSALERMLYIYELAGDNEKAADTCRTIASIHRNFKHTSAAENFEKKAEELQAAS